MRIDPFPNDVKKLKNTEYYRVDIGEYRLVYYVENDIIYFAVFGKRNDGGVYKKFKRMLDK